MGDQRERHAELATLPSSFKKAKCVKPPFSVTDPLAEGHLPASEGSAV